MPHRPTEAGAGTPTPNPSHDAEHAPAPVDLTEESVAGEEDPGASLDDGGGEAPPVPLPPGRQG